MPIPVHLVTTLWKYTKEKSLHNLKDFALNAWNFSKLYALKKYLSHVPNVKSIKIQPINDCFCNSRDLSLKTENQI
jgi:hypothetical protein